MPSVLGGQCCYIVIDGKQTDIPCPYLKFLPDGTTKCKIYYRNRVGRNIGYGNKCHLRANSPWDYPNCPYNTGKPMIQKAKP